MRWMLVERVAESCRAPLNYIAHKLYGMCVEGGGGEVRFNSTLLFADT